MTDKEVKANKDSKSSQQSGKYQNKKETDSKRKEYGTSPKKESAGVKTSPRKEAKASDDASKAKKA